MNCKLDLLKTYNYSKYEKNRKVIYEHLSTYIIKHFLAAVSKGNCSKRNVPGEEVYNV